MTINTNNELIQRTAGQLVHAAGIIGGKAWGADRGTPRIYMPARRDTKVYFAFEDYPTGDEGDLLGGARLCVYIDECGQHPNWYKSQREKLMRRHRREFLALAALHADEEGLAHEIMELDADEITGEMVDAAGGHLANGRAAEAREAIGL